MKLGVNESSLNLRRQHDLPTPESPIRRSFIYTVGPMLVDPTSSSTGMWGGGRLGGGWVGAYQEVIVSITGHGESERAAVTRGRGKRKILSGDR